MAILYTSGTTAFPKGAVILHRNADVPRTPGPHGDKGQKRRLRELYLAETRTGS